MFRLNPYQHANAQVFFAPAAGVVVHVHPVPVLAAVPAVHVHPAAALPAVPVVHVHVHPLAQVPNALPAPAHGANVHGHFYPQPIVNRQFVEQQHQLFLQQHQRQVAGQQAP